MARPCTERPNTAVVHPSPGTGDGMSDGGRTSHVSGCSPAGLQANWPTTGGGVVVGVALVGAAAIVVDVVLVEDSGNAVVGGVGPDVVVELLVAGAVAVGVMLDVGACVTEPATDSFADDSTLVVHPAAASPTMSTANVPIDVR